MPFPGLPHLLLLLLLLYPGMWGSPFSLRIEPQEAVVRTWSSLLFNCSSDCPNLEKLGLETSLHKAVNASGTHWRTYVVKAGADQGRVLCFANCNGTQMQTEVNITTYEPPKHVKLVPPQYWLSMGASYTVGCRVVGAVPFTSLTVVWLRGTRELGHQSFQEKASEFPEFTANFTSLAHREDHGANLSCRADLNLTNLGLEIFQGHSEPIRLRVFEFLSLPRLNLSEVNGTWLLEAESPKSVSCEAEVFPVEEAQVYLSLGGQAQNITVTRQGDRLTAEATVWAEKGPKRELDLNCTVAVGDESRTAHKTLTVYNFPLPKMTLSEPSPLEKTPVNVSCTARPGTSVKLEGQPEQSPGEPAYLELIARGQDDGRLLSCEATLSLGSVQLVKRQNIRLHVLYGPRMNASDCPGNWTWPEGTEQVLRCQARGNPTPTVQCIHTEIKSTFFPGTPLQITRAHAGTYRCIARSELGTEARDVVVTVDFNDVNVVAIVTVVLVIGVIAAGLGIAGYRHYRQPRIGLYQVENSQRWAMNKLPKRDMMNPQPPCLSNS
ncbi:intercellular adhesion molecule 3 isoform X1 [Ornithorhynchus anatinus]|uniref:intercellular adhesion molecule 3 isoform X1 n=1 Tax=Ornithorhynchus anatinus TaxID=9258 RepID=UPI00028F41AD|nr:intercellular adhesion molecule 3 isoform X1 [Ornithorhynchus anatinus]